jgi:hypothetical protein
LKMQKTKTKNDAKKNRKKNHNANLKFLILKFCFEKCNA